MSENLDNLIRQNAQGPAKVTSDAGSVEQYSLAELIAAARYLASQEKVQHKWRGLRCNKLVPPGVS